MARVLGDSSKEAEIHRSARFATMLERQRQRRSTGKDYGGCLGFTDWRSPDTPYWAALRAIDAAVAYGARSGRSNSSSMNRPEATNRIGMKPSTTA
jgi:hypothetical protein